MKSKMNRVPVPLVGRFFHSLKDGQIHWQGAVHGNPEPGWYMVVLFEWVTGAPNVERLVRIEEMASWFFYRDAEEMKESFDSGVARKGGPYRNKT